MCWKLSFLAPPSCLILLIIFFISSISSLPPPMKLRAIGKELNSEDTADGLERAGLERPVALYKLDNIPLGAVALVTALNCEELAVKKNMTVNPNIATPAQNVKWLM